MVDNILTVNDLAHFYGSDTFTKWSRLFPNCLLTEGATYVAEKAGAYWLMDKIAASQYESHISVEEFQAWSLSVEQNSGSLVLDDGNGNTVFSEEIKFTDFPLPCLKLYACANELGGVTIMLPSEY